MRWPNPWIAVPALLVVRVVAEAEVGAGHLYMFGPAVLFRGQPHGTFKLFFNGIFLGGTTEIQLGSPATEESN